MPIEIPGEALLRLPPLLDMNAAGPLAEVFLDMRGRDLTVDASAVERMGAQCLQVLLSAQATWAAEGWRLVMDQPSAEFTAVVNLLGATEIIGGLAETPIEAAEMNA